MTKRLSQAPFQVLERSPLEVTSVFGHSWTREGPTENEWQTLRFLRDVRFGANAAFDVVIKHERISFNVTGNRPEFSNCSLPKMKSHQCQVVL